MLLSTPQPMPLSVGKEGSLQPTPDCHAWPSTAATGKAPSAEIRSPWLHLRAWRLAYHSQSPCPHLYNCSKLRPLAFWLWISWMASSSTFHVFSAAMHACMARAVIATVPCRVRGAPPPACGQVPCPHPRS